MKSEWIWIAVAGVIAWALSKVSWPAVKAGSEAASSVITAIETPRHSLPGGTTGSIVGDAFSDYLDWSVSVDISSWWDFQDPDQTTVAKPEYKNDNDFVEKVYADTNGGQNVPSDERTAILTRLAGILPVEIEYPHYILTGTNRSKALTLWATITGVSYSTMAK